MLWYSLEVPQQGASNEYPEHMFSSRNKKNIMWIPVLSVAMTEMIRVMLNRCISNKYPQHMFSLRNVVRESFTQVLLLSKTFHLF